MSGCTRAVQVEVRLPMNGLRRPKLSCNKHLVGLKEQLVLGVLAAVVQMVRDKQGRSWVHIFARMDLWKAIPDGSCTVKMIV